MEQEIFEGRELEIEEIEKLNEGSPIMPGALPKGVGGRPAGPYPKPEQRGLAPSTVPGSRISCSPEQECFLLRLEEVLRSFRISTNLPVNVSPPWNSTYFEARGQVVLPAGGPITTITTTIPVLPGHIVVIEEWIQGITGPVDRWDDVDWTVSLARANSGFGPMRGFIAVDFRGSFGMPFKMRRRLGEREQMRVQAINNSAIAFEGLSILRGWMFAPRLYTDEASAAITVQD